jgi:hypothetical protein
MKLSKKQLALIALVVVLAISNIAFAVLYETRNVDFTGGVSVIGDIEVFRDDGTTVLTSFDFPNFTGGVAYTHQLDFFINNTGNQPLYVYWNISTSTSTSSVAWSIQIDHYRGYEAAAHKYSFSIYNGTSDFWTPDTEARMIPVGQRIQERFELMYIGDPATAETFSLTVTFYARDA